VKQRQKTTAVGQEAVALLGDLSQHAAMTTPRKKTTQPRRPGAVRAQDPRPTRRQAKFQAAREALLEAALSVMSGKGVHDSRIEDITQAADVAKGSFYAHFRDKDDILAAVLRRVLDDLRQRLEGGPVAGKPVSARVRFVVEAQASLVEGRPGLVVLLHQSRGLVMQRKGVFPRVRKVLAEHVEVVAAALAGRGAPVLERDTDAARVTMALVQGCQGMGMAMDGRGGHATEVITQAAAAAASCIMGGTGRARGASGR
jgi:AcrR family transcriptional regulator